MKETVTPEELIAEYNVDKTEPSVNYIAQDSDGTLKLIFDDSMPVPCYHVFTPNWQSRSGLCSQQYFTMADGFHLDWGKDRSKWDERIVTKQKEQER